MVRILLSLLFGYKRLGFALLGYCEELF